MRSRKILGFVALGLMMAMPAALFGQNSRPRPSLSVRQLADQEIFNLQRNTERADSSLAGLNLLTQSLLRIRQLRQASPKQFADDETYMNRLESALAAIPSPGTFLAASCDKYHSQILHHFDPKAVGESHDPAIAKAIFSLDQVCGKK